jgi:hypothetical protein
MFQAQTTLIFFSLYMLCISSNQLRIRACGLTITFPQNQNCLSTVVFGWWLVGVNFTPQNQTFVARGAL